MRQTDRDYFLNTIAVLQNQKHSILRVLQDMDLRLEELEESLVLMFDQDEQDVIDTMLDDARFEGFESAMEYMIIPDEEDEIVYDSARKKQCMCDDCWGVKTDEYHHRMD
jgi:hypothetical protein